MLRSFRAAFGLGLALVGSVLALAGDWPQFRGPAGDGHSPARNVPVRWSDTENIAWRTPIPGRGWSSPVVEGDSIWLTTAIVEEASAEERKQKLAAVPNANGLEVAGKVVLRALCLDRKSGQITRDVALLTIDSPEPIHSLNSFASPTPVLDEGRLYCHFGTYGTVCLDTASGELLWQNEDLRLDHQNGPGSSPIIWRDLLIVHCDGMDVQYIVALDKQTGKLAWRTNRSGKLPELPPYRKAYCTPLVIPAPGGGEQLISPAADWVYSYDPATGRELWRAGYGELGFSNVARPVAENGVVYICTCFMNSRLLAIRADGAGDVTGTHVLWTHDKQVPKLPSPILVEGRLYMVSDNGVASCLDAASGELLWRERLGGDFCASPIYVEGRLYFCNREGKTYVVRPGATFEAPVVNSIEGEFMASPVPLDGGLLLRTASQLVMVGQDVASRP